MSVLLIGQSAFLASEIMTSPPEKWHFLSHQEGEGFWPSGIKTVVNFACDPVVKEGKYSDYDYKIAKKTKEHGASYIMLSSRTAYGFPTDPVEFTESMPQLERITPYGHAKKSIEEKLLKDFNHVTVLRLSNIFGFEYDRVNPRQTFFGIMLKTLKEEGSIRFSMSPATRRDFMPLPLFTSRLIKIAENPKPGIYNLGSGIGAMIEEIAQWVMSGYGKGEIKFTDNRIIDSFVLNMNKTRSTYDIQNVQMEDIKKYCKLLGSQLKDA